MIIIDSREPDKVPESIIGSTAWLGQKIAIEKLDSGDFVFAYLSRDTGGWEREVGLESKTYSDLLTSLKSKRLTQQVMKLQATYPVAGLLVKGTYQEETYLRPPNPLDQFIMVGGRETRWTIKSVEGLKLAMQDRGLKVIECPEEERLPYVLRWLHDHYLSHRTDSDHFATGMAVPIAMLDVVPGVTYETARKLHEGLDREPDSIGGVIAATTSDMERMVNSRTAREIFRRLH